MSYKKINKRKVLIIGSTGTLGSSFYNFLKQKKDFKAIGISRENKDHSVDITNKLKFISVLYKINPDIIVNCSGIVDINYCQENPYKAWDMHVNSMLSLYEYLSEKNKKYVHISTDQFYDGKNKKNKEDSGISFVSEYAKTKYFADIIASKCQNSIVVRTNIIGFRGTKKKNFIEQMIADINSQKKLTLFDDYIVSSIDTSNLCEILLHLIKTDFKGIINIGSSQPYSKRKMILVLAKKLNKKLNGHIVSSATKLKVKRQLNCGLDVSKIEKYLGKKMPNLSQVIGNIIEEYKKI